MYSELYLLLDKEVENVIGGRIGRTELPFNGVSISMITVVKVNGFKNALSDLFRCSSSTLPARALTATKSPFKDMVDCVGRPTSMRTDLWRKAFGKDASIPCTRDSEFTLYPALRALHTNPSLTDEPSVTIRHPLPTFAGPTTTDIASISGASPIPSCECWEDDDNPPFTLSFSARSWKSIPITSQPTATPHPVDMPIQTFDEQRDVRPDHSDDCVQSQPATNPHPMFCSGMTITRLRVCFWNTCC